MSASADAGECTRSATAPTARDQRVLVDPEVGADRGRPGVGGQHEHRRAALGRLGDAGHRVGQPAALVHASARRPGRWCGRRRRPSSPRRPRAGRRGTGTPAARSALVTWKLPLPTTPNACPTPSSASARPTSSATSGIEPSRLDQGQYPRRAPGPVDDRQRTGDHHRPGGRQPGQVLQLGQPVLARARAGRSGTGTAGRTSARRPRRCPPSPRRPRAPADSSASQRRTPHGDARRVRAGLVGVQERGRVLAAGVPAGAVEQPAAVGQRAVLGLPGPDVRRPRAGSPGRRRSAEKSSTAAGATSRAGGTWATSSPSLPVTQWIGASKWVPVCSEVWMSFQYQAGPALVVVADLGQPERRGVGERRRQLQDRGAAVQRRGEVDDLARGRSAARRSGRSARPWRAPRFGGGRSRPASRTADPRASDRPQSFRPAAAPRPPGRPARPAVDGSITAKWSTPGSVTSSAASPAARAAATNRSLCRIGTLASAVPCTHTTGTPIGSRATGEASA